MKKLRYTPEGEGCSAVSATESMSHGKKKRGIREDAAREKMLQTDAPATSPIQSAVKEAVMSFGMIDAMRLRVFLAVEVQFVTPGEVAVVHGPVTVFLPLDVLFAAFQAVGLSRAEPAGGDSVIDASLLVVQPAVHLMEARMTEVDGTGVAWKCEAAKRCGKSESEKRFHGV